jgi:hypothetical protein
MHDAGCRIQDAGFMMHDTEFWEQSFMNHWKRSRGDHEKRV